jgi:hypothetical protein
VTRKPSGHPEADGDWGPSGPARPRLSHAPSGSPPRAPTGPLPRADTGPLPRIPARPHPADTGPLPRIPARPGPAGTGPLPRIPARPHPADTGPLPRIPARPDPTGTGPLPRIPAGPDPAGTGPLPRIPSGRDPWGYSAPGFEFEARRAQPGRPPRRAQPGRPDQTADPRPRPGPPPGPGDTGPRTGPQQALRTGPQEALRDTRPAEAPREPRRFRYTPTVSQPRPVPPPAWPDDVPPAPPGSSPTGFTRPASPTRVDPSRTVPRQGYVHDSGPRQAYGQDSGAYGQDSGPRQDSGRDSGPHPLPPRQVVTDRGRGQPPRERDRPPRERARPDLRAASAEWAKLAGSFVPAPVKRRWSREFLAGLEFRGWGMRVAIPILAMVVFGVAVVVIAGANNGNAGPTPPAAALGFPPATLAGNDFTATASGRGITQTLGRVTSVGNEVVAVGSQSGARIGRAQFFVSADGGHSWTLGTVRSASGGVPAPGHGAIFVAGGQGAWLALGPGSVWTSPDGRTWTLAPGNGLPLVPGDQINAVQRTASGFIAVGANVPGGDQAKSTPVIFLSANGTSWQRLDAARLHLGRALDIRYAATSGKLILIGGDALTTRAQVQAGAAWLSSDGGSTWVPVASSAAHRGSQPQLAGLAAVNGGFVLLRPATVAKHPAVDAFYSPNGVTWTFQATLSATGGFTAEMVNGGPAGAAITGQTNAVGQDGGSLTAFVSSDGKTWRQARPFGSAGSETISGLALAPDGTVITAGVSPGPDSRQPVLVLARTGADPERVAIAKIPGAVDAQVAVNAVAAEGGTQVAAGSANGFPAVWTSANGGSAWSRATGASPGVFGRPGTQRLTSVTHGPMGWLAVGGVTASAAEHPVVVVSADAASWQAADGEPAFTGPGLFTQAAAANGQGLVIVGDQKIKQERDGRVVSVRTVAAAWWSTGLTGWQRAGDGSAGALDGAGDRRMLDVTAAQGGFVAVGAHGRQPSAWTSADGRSWRQVDLPVPAGASQAGLEHVASIGRTVAAVGTMVTATGQTVPFAARSANDGVTWTESVLPDPAGLTTVTALTAAGRTFTATGSYGSTPGHQNVVVWTSPDGAAWQAAEPAGQGLTGPGIQAITSLTASGNTLTGVGFSASPNTEQPVFWQAPVR